MAKADTTKVDKAETSRIDKAETTKIESKIDKADKIDKAEMTKIDKPDTTKIDFDAMSIEELATLRDTASAKLLEKVTARQVELEAEIERLAQYGKQSKKAVATAPVARAKKVKADDVSSSPATDTVAAAA